MTRTFHVIGAGLAGLAAAHALALRGHAVTLHEATPGAGGRARALPDGTDNGTHALIGCNTAALEFLDAVGARQYWVQPEPEGLPVYDCADSSARLVALSPAGWWNGARRPAGASWGGVLAMLAMALPPFGPFGQDRTIAEAMAEHPDFLRGFVDPLVIAALNTPSAEASTHRLGQVLRRLGPPGAARLFVARRGLGPDLVEPALAVLAAAGAEYRPGSRLRAIQLREGRATSLTFQEQDVMLGEGDRVILALPPWEAQRMLPGLPAPDAFAPIVNLHFAFAPQGQVRFLGLLGALCQWVLIRPEGVAVTVSAGDAEAEQDVAELAPRAWGEILRAVRAFHVPGDWPETPPPCRVIKERRATPRQRPGPIPTPPRRPLANLALAGDWTWPHLPATIEAAIRSGQDAAREIQQ